MAAMNHKGGRVVWCASCGAWIKVPGIYRPVCQECGSPIKTFRCTRCGHEWKPKDPRRIPDRCPQCNNPYAFYTRVRTVAAPPPVVRPRREDIRPEPSPAAGQRGEEA